MWEGKVLSPTIQLPWQKQQVMWYPLLLLGFEQS